MEDFEYEIYYRLDEVDDVFSQTDSVIVKGDSIEEIMHHVIQIERRNTIISIKNLSLL